MIRITTFAGKRVAVFGLGASGIATAKALVAGGAEVVASDDNAAGMQAAAEAGLKTADLKQTNWADLRFARAGAGRAADASRAALDRAGGQARRRRGDRRPRAVRARAAGAEVPRAAHRHHRHQRQIDDDGADGAHPQGGRPRHAGRRQHRHRHAVAGGVRAGPALRHRVLVVSDRSGAQPRCLPSACCST